jgi:uncharacterized membrane protein YeaQ/YmgE (transglycosylase-associated protein family)
MFAALAEGIVVRIGDHVWVFGLSFLLYILMAAIVGAIAEAIVGSHVPFGIVGAIIAGVIGVWLMTQVIVISGISVNGQEDIMLWGGVPLIRGLIGAIIFVALWHLITYGFRRVHYYRTREPAHL